MQPYQPSHGEFIIRDPSVLNRIAPDRSNRKKKEAVQQKKKTDRVTQSTATDRNRGTRPTNSTTIARRGKGADVYLASDPPRLLATGRRRRVGREAAISSGSAAGEPERNETSGGLGGISKTYLLFRSSPRRREEQNGRDFFLYIFSSACCAVSPDRCEREGRGLRAAPTSRRVKGQRPQGPRVGDSGKARAVPWLSWRPSVQPAMLIRVAH